MSEFVVRVVPITRIDPHLDADRIELAVIGEFRSVVVKGRFKTGDLVAYIPEASLVPGALLNEMNLVGKLAGSQKNRVKAMSRAKLLILFLIILKIRKISWK